MLYYLDESLAVNSEDVRERDIVRVVRNLAISVEESKHYMLADYETLKYFRRVFPNDPFITPLFDHLIANFSFASIPSFIDRYVVISANDSLTYERDNKLVIQINYLQLLDSNSFRCTALICEDINDCLFYRHILDCFLEKHHVVNKVALTNIHGGGDRIDVIAMNEVRDHHFGLVIVDGDYKYPGDTEGDTAMKCRKKFAKCPFLFLEILTVREIENLIPISYLHLNPRLTHPSRRPKLNQLLSFDKIYEDIYKYIDIKSGWKMKDLTENAEYLDFVEFCLEHSSLINGKSVGTYIEDKQSRGEHMLLEGLGNDVLKLVLENIEKMQSKMSDLLSFQLNIWNTLALLMINVGFCRDQEQLN